MNAPMLSVVVPVFDEEAAIAPLVEEIVAALRGLTAFEVVYVDDASRDGSLQVLQRLRTEAPELRVVSHAQRCGQSMAIRNGVKAARGDWIATLDGDGQNDPADIPKLLAARDAADASIRLLTGWRRQRMDSRSKRLASRAGNTIRAWALGDATPDSGCGIRLFEREAFLELPCFDHMHRFLPALFQRAGWGTSSVPVAHRARASGVSKYGNLDRALAGVRDLVGVSWLIARSRCTEVSELP